jgi:hypothetical protein
MPSDRVASPLASNNPFRNKIGSGATSPTNAGPVIAPISNNPFLDSNEVTVDSNKPIIASSSASSKVGTTEKATELLVSTSTHTLEVGLIVSRRILLSTQRRSLPIEDHGLQLMANRDAKICHPAPSEEALHPVTGPL